jgi:hypothetical protein
MLYYWQTKYNTLIYRPFFIFSHNRHFFVHIFPNVLGVWKYPFCKIPFQPSEDTEALLSELPPLSHNVVHIANSSQIRKEFLNYGPSGAISPGAQNWGGAKMPPPHFLILGPGNCPRADQIRPTWHYSSFNFTITHHHEPNIVATTIIVGSWLWAIVKLKKSYSSRIWSILALRSSTLLSPIIRYSGNSSAAPVLHPN